MLKIFFSCSVALIILFPISSNFEPCFHWNLNDLQRVIFLLYQISTNYHVEFSICKAKTMTICRNEAVRIKIVINNTIVDLGCNIKIKKLSKYMRHNSKTTGKENNIRYYHEVLQCNCCTYAALWLRMLCY